MNIVKLIATSVNFFICFMIAGAQAETKLPSEYKKCMDAVDLGAFKNAQWASCAAQEIKIQDAILNSEYNKLINALTSEQRSALLKGQHSWIKFRDDWCRFEELSSAAPGSAANYNFCILEETTKQASKLKELNR
jgi:uncharacterized protein YecT (DUF1311 family)